MTPEKYTVAQIREALERVAAADYEIDYETAPPLEEVLFEMIDEEQVTANGLRAGLQFMESNDEAPKTAASLPEWWKEHYKKAWPSKGAFAQDDTMQYYESSTAEAIGKLDEWINWEGLGDSYTYSDHVFIELDDELHVFTN